MLTNWQKKWRIPQAAIDELLSIAGVPGSSAPGKSEAAIQQEIKLSASRAGARLWRNNCGVATNPAGQPVRYGLANDSMQLNRKIKSSDLIGIMPRVIQSDDVGKTMGIFTAIEVKKAGWKYSGTKREQAQLNFILLVLSLGGIARFQNDGKF